METRPEVTEAVTRGTARLLVDMGYAPIFELSLPNGRRADIAAVSKKGEILMVEVKSCRADFEVDKKWPEYREYCDLFYFAVPEDFPVELLPEDEALIIADGFGGAIVRPSEKITLAGARRKQTLIRIARSAAFKGLATPRV
ncbi:MmcB family DNA repair protein [Parvularcula sp. ZS-1/3]|uniref:MmcB family DNA repair protein n=1 Tax=Parvularcula mediterranea TaxID=2732508 RepID=A0A7Y3RL95_9PROT|nr:MmcB family DNA repair protein [Parvularcula mediterranea]NNU16090.1 MmcB family DNA repair protein [Parvularcula mediterranea]